MGTRAGAAQRRPRPPRAAGTAPTPAPGWRAPTAIPTSCTLPPGNPGLSRKDPDFTLEFRLVSGLEMGNCCSPNNLHVATLPKRSGGPCKHLPQGRAMYQGDGPSICGGSCTTRWAVAHACTMSRACNQLQAKDVNVTFQSSAQPTPAPCCIQSDQSEQLLAACSEEEHL